jgi:quercetin dioxygenase-like cupin family protein
VFEARLHQNVERRRGMEHSLTGWDIAEAADVEWAPWGCRGDARARLMASADGYNVVIVVAEPGYAADAHVHGFPEFLYVIDGTMRVQGHLLAGGDAYAAAAGSVHTELRTDSGATYLSIFKL